MKSKEKIVQNAQLNESQKIKNKKKGIIPKDKLNSN